MTISEDKMLSELGLTPIDLDEADIAVRVLYDIYNDYLAIKSNLEKQAEYLAGILNLCPEVNSVKWRVKDALHLLTKIIRKRKEALRKHHKNSEYLKIDVSNYKEVITDMIGLRAIFIFKAHWSLVDEYIFDNLTVCADEEITIYHASDDNLTFFPASDSIKKYNGLNYTYKLVQKDTRYRSIHYILQGVQPNGYRLELQTRTILDEAWGEIDHYIRYPHNENHPELLRKMSILNGQISGCEEHTSQAYKYYSSMETNKIDTMANSQSTTIVSEKIEDTIKVNDDEYASKKGRPYENVMSAVASKSFRDIEEIARISKTVKSMNPLRSFEGYEQNSALKQIESLNAGLVDPYVFAGALTKSIIENSAVNLTKEISENSTVNIAVNLTKSINEK